MDDTTIEKLSADIEDLKRAVRRNDPMLREVSSPPGWVAFSALAGLNISLFALPAHLLATCHGGFDAIPTPGKLALFAVLALFVVGGGTLKVVLMTRRAEQVAGAEGLARLLDAFFGGRMAHVTMPLTLGMVAGIAYAFYAGRPWLALPVSSFLFGVMANVIAGKGGLRAYYVIGYWGILLGLAALPLVERAPFLWLFVIYGGMFFAFAITQAADNAVARGAGQDSRQTTDRSDAPDGREAGD